MLISRIVATCYGGPFSGPPSAPPHEPDEAHLFGRCVSVQGGAVILSLHPTTDGRYEVVLDQTLFHPQGGGQPYDQGEISSDQEKFFVEEVRFRDNVVVHIGRFSAGPFSVGQSAQMAVDETRRALNRRNHSAGHLIDSALTSLGVSLVPTKGFHFPEGPYVEYQGIFAENEREAMRENLEVEANRLVQRNLPVTFRTEQIEGKNVRIVTIS
ncbi:MAG TPA: alanine--tRNA ligase-related protein [Bdellovibrionota bacterium]|nr:alanine--tRNA ligase-related protein [Bdellovibrionota bacterium]